MSSNDTSKSAGSIFASLINAKEFVPTSPALASNAATSSTSLVGGLVSAELVKAKEFVPQAVQTAVASKQGGGKNSVSAVPRGQGGGNRRPGASGQGSEDFPSTSQLQSLQGGGKGAYAGWNVSPVKAGGRGQSSIAVGVPSPSYSGTRSVGRGGSDGGSSSSMGGAGYSGRGRGMGRGSYAAASGSMMSGPTGGPQGYPGIMSMAAAGPSTLPAQRHHEPYLMGPGRAMLQMRFINDGIRQQLQQQSYLVQAQWSQETAGVRAEEFVPLPEKVHNYHTLYPLEEPSADGNDKMSAALGLRTFVMKAISSLDGQAYAIRRVCGKQVIPSADLLSHARSAVEAWSPVSNHPNIAGLRAAFVSSEMDGGSALFFVHDYQPGCLTLAQAHLVPSASSSGVVALNPASEAQLWSYLVQLTSAIRCVHNAGLALRPGCLHPSKILLSSLGHISVGCVGMLDALNPGDLHDQDDPHHMHRLELSALGQLLLTLACAGIAPSPTLDACAAHYSIELTRIIAALLASAEGGQLNSWRQLAAALADRTIAELDSVNIFGNAMMSELAKECDNGRLLRLLVKLGFVNERPELDGDTQWAETGDRYLLKLFRDFVFHQTSEDGTAITDWGHVIEALNKLDAGVPEKILLMSRDEQSMLVVSYADLKRCVEGTYADVQQAGTHRTQ